MRRAAAILGLLLLSACSSGEDQAQDAGEKSDPVADHAKSLEKAADASVKLVEKDAQEQIDAAQAEQEAAVAMPEEQ